MEKFKLLSERLKWAVQRRLDSEPGLKRITNNKLALEAGVSPPAVGYWFSDTNGIQAEAARKLSSYLGIDPVWLEKGEGDPLPREGETEGYRVVEAGAHRFVEIPLVELKLSAGLTGYQTVPLGGEDSTILTRLSWITRRRLNPKTILAIEITGDSMEKSLFHGDIGFMDFSDTRLVDGEVYAVNYEGTAVVKRLQRDAGDWWLTSDNESPGRHQRKVCRGDDCIIVGKIVHKESDRI